MRAALFDMDRTLIRKDTARLYVRYQRDVGEATWRDTLQVGWWLVQYTLGVINAERVAEQVLAAYAGASEQHMVDRCKGWFRDYVLEHVSDRGREVVAEHRDRGDALVIVTGATRYAAEPLARELGIEHVLCTQLEVDADGKFTGRVQKPLCYGAGKITMVEQLAGDASWSVDDAVFYSDSITDLPLLERVGTPVVVNPDARLRRTARERGWTIEQW